MKLIVGLGNPGEKYAKVRHNLGFVVLDALGDRLQGTVDSWEDNKKLKSLVCNLKTVNCNLILAKPQTYMNNSGLAVKLLTAYYKLPVADVIVIHDDLDLILGQIKVRTGGAAAGHHGVESIISAIGDQFMRVRIGIGRGKYPEKFVLEPFLPSEKSKVKHTIKQAVQVVVDNLRSEM